MPLRENLDLVPDVCRDSGDRVVQIDKSICDRRIVGIPHLSPASLISRASVSRGKLSQVNR